MVAMYAGKICVATWVGQSLLTIGKGEKGIVSMGVMANGRWVIKTSHVVGQMVIGLLIVYGIRMVPYVGF
jgi:hypothetical protein